jgi:hypothetical protein
LSGLSATKLGGQRTSLSEKKQSVSSINFLSSLIFDMILSVNTYFIPLQLKFIYGIKNPVCSMNQYLHFELRLQQKVAKIPVSYTIYVRM